MANAAVLGAVPLGQARAVRSSAAKIADGSTENRGGESTLGNLVAEVQRWATRDPESGSAQIAFMNPGGLRADMVGTGTGAFPRTLTYQQAAEVQPFANTLVNMDLTGAQIKAVLEQQWQPRGGVAGRSSSSASRRASPTPSTTVQRRAGSRITGMWLNGSPIVPSTVYSVTVNSFLAVGWRQLRGFNGGPNKQDTGKIDLQAMVDYMAEFANTTAGDPPLPVDYKQHGVGVAFPAGAPASYKAGDHVQLQRLLVVDDGRRSTARTPTVVVKLGGDHARLVPARQRRRRRPCRASTRWARRRSTWCCRTASAVARRTSSCREPRPGPASRCR